MRCSNCENVNPVRARFCQNCGQALHRICPHCETSYSPSANFCIECGTALREKPGDVKEPRLNTLHQVAPPALQNKMRAAGRQLEGERKPVTILFSDIVGSTTLAEKLDPEEWKEVVAGSHRQVSKAVYMYEGTIAQLLGDGVLAFFGAPLTHEDDPERAVRAALDIQAAMAVYRAELAGYVGDFQVRIGLHTGEVVVGQIGDDLHMEYLALGDAVNLAARLQGEAEPGGVLISESTARLVRGQFDLEALGEIDLKGKATAVPAYSVSRLKKVPEGARGLPGLSTPYIGRDQELSQVTASLEKLIEGFGGLVFILGEAGIGKSRLVEEAWRQIENSKSNEGSPTLRSGSTIRWLEGRAISYGANLSYWPIIQVLQGDLDLADGDPAPKVRVALRRRVKKLFGEGSAQVEPYLAHLMGISLEGAAADQIQILDGEALKWQTHQALSAYLGHVADEGPTVLVFEDLHWADPSTLEVLEELVALSDRAPLLIVVLMRVDREHKSWQLRITAESQFPHRYNEINLQQLSRKSALDLVTGILTTADLPPHFRDQILTRAEGNPLFLEEIIRSMIDQGQLVKESGSWRIPEEINEISIPETLHGVLLARLDRLDEAVRRTLQLASVIGRSFRFKLLAAISGDEKELKTHLVQLQRGDLIREKAPRPELEYIFKHSLTQEAAYNSLLLEHRQVFHQQVAIALETIFPDRKEELLGLLAHHYDQAGQQEKAVGYMVAAGDKARFEDAHSEAVGFYLRAIALLDQENNLIQTAQTWLKLGLVYHADFQFSKAHEAYERAFVLRRKIPKLPQGVQVELPSSYGGAPLRFAYQRYDLYDLDPATLVTHHEGVIASAIFAGIAEIDIELNVIPHAARSWEVFEGGRRYLIYLRDDVHWTDGNPVTAFDYEYAWKRNMSSAVPYQVSNLLGDIQGVQEYRAGKSTDQNLIGVRPRDEFTLEVTLSSPVPYFPYLFAHAITYPVPRKVVERFGENWWHPDHIQSNGPFRLVSFEPGKKVEIRRNPGYFGRFSGNLDQISWQNIPDVHERVNLFRRGDLDFIGFWGEDIPDDLPQLVSMTSKLQTVFWILLPRPPLDNPLVRRALIHALDREALAKEFRMVPPYGGLIPPGIPGHTPDLGLPFDPDLARRLLAQAGYPGGKGFPKIHGKNPFVLGIDEFQRQMKEVLGIEAVLEPTDWHEGYGEKDIYSFGGWMADYPDPDAFLSKAYFFDLWKGGGWVDEKFEALVDQAAYTIDRKQRMALCRAADRRLVIDQALIAPLGHFMVENAVIHPRVRHFPLSAMNLVNFREVVVERE